MLESSNNEFPERSIPLPASDPCRLMFRTGDITGGGAADGKQVLCMTVLPVDDNETPGGAPLPVTLIFSRESAHKIGKAVMEFLSMDPYAEPLET